MQVQQLARPSHNLEKFVFTDCISVFIAPLKTKVNQLNVVVDLILCSPQILSFLSLTKNEIYATLI